MPVNRILILFEIIPGAVRRNILTRQETDDRIENVIKDWLKYASDRDGGRKKNESYGSVNSHGLWACANILTPKTGTDQTRNTIALFWYS